MTKFGRKARYEPRVASDPSRTVNLAGGVAYKPSDKVELVKRVLTWYVAEPKFYGNTTDETVRIMELVNRIGREDPEFILKLAVFARNVMYLRSAPVFLLVEGLSISEIRRKFKCSNCGSQLKSRYFLVAFIISLMIWSAIVSPLVGLISKESYIMVLIEALIGVFVSLIVSIKLMKIEKV